MIRAPQAPAFWYQPPGILSALLGPAAAIWRARARKRIAGRPAGQNPVPVICVGNLVTGGAGKTPVAIALCRILAEQGHRPAFLTRGYGGRISRATIIDAGHTSFDEAGDEALLLAREAMTVVSPDRAEGVAIAAQNGASLVIMDDGFQNREVMPDTGLLVFDGASGIGNGCVMPAGPLREGLGDALQRAAAAIIIGDDRTGLAATLPADLPVFTAHSHTGPDAPDLAGVRVFGFCGIARPGKFRNSLQAAGAEVAGFAAFADHHRFTPREAAGIIEQAQALNALPVTTAKDQVRLPDELREKITVLPVEIRFDRRDRLLAFLADRLKDDAP